MNCSLFHLSLTSAAPVSRPSVCPSIDSSSGVRLICCGAARAPAADIDRQPVRGGAGAQQRMRAASRREPTEEVQSGWLVLEACNVLNDLRKSGQLCDAVLRVEDGHFTVHRAIMSACSPYFRALFTNGIHETDKREVATEHTVYTIHYTLIDSQLHKIHRVPDK